MRVLLVTELLPAPIIGGLGRHVISLARALHAQGIGVGLLVRGDTPQACAELDALQAQGVTLHRTIKLGRTGWKERQLGIFLAPKRAFAARQIARAIRKCSPDYDVIHYHGHYHSMALYLGALVSRTVVTLHDYSGICPTKMAYYDGRICNVGENTPCAECLFQIRGGVRAQLTKMGVSAWRKSVGRAVRRVTVIAVSNAVIEMYRTALGQFEAQAVPNFVDEDLLSKIDGTLDLNASYGIPSGKAVAVLASTLQPEKGVRAFVKEYVKTSVDRPALVVVGVGPELEGLRSEFVNQGIFFTGWLPYTETLRHIAAADAFVVTSQLAEPSTTTIMEAHFFGVPVYALRRGGVAQVLGWSGGPGAVFDDLSELARAVATASQSCRKVAEDYRLSVQRVAPHLLKMYRSLHPAEK